MRVTSSERWRTVRTSWRVAPPSNSRAVRRVETWSRRVRYLSSVASAWLALAEHDRDVLEDVLRAVDVERDDLAALGDRDDQRVGLLETRSAVRWRVPVSRERIVGSGTSWTLAIVIFVAFAFRTIPPSILATW
jgi:hypothetical protein